MSSPSALLHSADGELVDRAAVIEALCGDFTVTSGVTETVRRTHLDTFDRRLRRAGLLLEDQQGPSGQQLVLCGQGQPLLTDRAAGLHWPALADALPPGPVREAVAPVSGIRALMALSEQDRLVCQVDLRNDDEKIVARLELDEPRDAGPTGRSHVTVHALRGYDDQARRAIRILAGLGLRPGHPGEDDAAAPEPAAAGIPRSAPASLLLAQAMRQFLAAMRDNLPGLIDDVDTEFLHDFRVAVRRTRSTLKFGRPALPDVTRTQWEPAFKWLGDLTTPVRDFDVYELGLPDMASWLVAADPAELAPFAAHLHRRRTAQRRVLVRGLRSAKFDRLLTGWDQTLDELTETPQTPGDQVSAGELSDRSLSRAYRRVARDGSAITADSPAEDLHSLRKRCKELRYVLEVFAPVIDKSERKGAVSDLKILQDVLGRFQDSQVQRESLRGFAQEMVAAGTTAGAVLAMGELVGHLDTEQHRARQEFGHAFAQFVRPASRRRLHKLGGGR